MAYSSFIWSNFDVRVGQAFLAAISYGPEISYMLRVYCSDNNSIYVCCQQRKFEFIVRKAFSLALKRYNILSATSFHNFRFFLYMYYS